MFETVAAIVFFLVAFALAAIAICIIVHFVVFVVFFLYMLICAIIGHDPF